MSVSELNQIISKQSFGNDAVALLSSINEAARRIPHDHKSIEEFYLFASHFFDRLFGEVTTGCNNVPEGWQSMKYGGWLKEFGAWSNGLNNTMRNSSNNGNVSGSNNASSANLSSMDVRNCRENVNKFYHALQVTLSCNGHMMDVLRRGRIFIMPMELLPRRARLTITDPAWIGYVQNNDDIHDYIMTWMRRIQEAASIENTVWLPPQEFFLVCLVRYPIINGSTMDLPQTFRDAFAPKGIPRASTASEMIVPLQPYNFLLYRYILDLLPHGNPISSDGWLFLHLAIENWVAAALIVRHSHGKCEQAKHAMRFGGALTNNATNGNDHPEASEVLFLNDSYKPVWNLPTLEAIYLLVWHLVSDPHLQSNIDSFERMSMDALLHANGSLSSTTSITALPPTLHLLQQPLFDMLRVLLSSGKSNLLKPTVNIWLAYIQPWIYQDGNKEPKQYTSKWKYFVAANLHFYTTILTAFFKCVAAQSSNWVVPDQDGMIAFNCLVQVCAIYTNPVLVKDIDDIVESALSSYRGRNRTCSGLAQIHLLAPNSPTDSSPDLFNRTSSPRKAQVTVSGPVQIDALQWSAIFQHQRLFIDANADNLRDCGFRSTQQSKQAVDRISGVVVSLIKQTKTSLVTSFLQILLDQLGTLGIVPDVNSGNFSRDSLLLAFELLGRFTDIKSIEMASEDDLTSPIENYEMKNWTWLLIHISTAMNNWWDFPRKKGCETLTFEQVWRNSVNSEHGDGGLDSRFQYLKNCFRFNLRFFGANTSVLLLLLVAYPVIGLRQLLKTCVLVAVVAYIHGWVIPIPPRGERTTGGAENLVEYDEDNEPICGAVTETLKKKSSIRYLGDPLDLPYFSGECVLLADALVRLSKTLNIKYHLPIERKVVTWSTEKVVKTAFRNWRKENPFSFLRKCFRFNLRFLANVQAVAAWFCSIATILWVTGKLNVVLFGIIACCSLLLYHIGPYL